MEFFRNIPYIGGMRCRKRVAATGGRRGVTSLMYAFSGLMLCRRRRIPLMLASMAIISIGLVSVVCAAEAQAEEKGGELHRQQQELKLELLRKRAELMSENERIAEVHQEIMRLYRKLDRLLAQQPEIQRLQERLSKLNTRSKEQETSASGE